MTDHSSPEKSPWGWKALIIAFILSAFFLGFFYLAVTNEPDYMPSQQNKKAPTTFKPPYKRPKAISLARIKVSNSILNVENVVKPPSIPVTTKSFIVAGKFM